MTIYINARCDQRHPATFKSHISECCFCMKPILNFPRFQLTLLNSNFVLFDMQCRVCLKTFWTHFKRLSSWVTPMWQRTVLAHTSSRWWSWKSYNPHITSLFLSSKHVKVSMGEGRDKHLYQFSKRLCKSGKKYSVREF